MRKDFLTLATFSNPVALVRRQKKQLEIFATVAWLIWCRRNNLRCNEQCMPLGKIMESAASLLSDFQKHYSHGVKSTKAEGTKLASGNHLQQL